MGAGDRSATRSVISIAMMCTLIAVIHGSGYAVLAVLPGFEPADHLLLAAWSAGTLVAAFTLVPIILALVLRPIDIALQAVRNGKPVAAEAFESARRRVLQLPSAASRALMVVWMPCALSFVPLYAHRHPGELLLPALHVAAVTILIGNVALIFTYYASERIARRQLIPIFFPSGELSRVAGIRGVSLRFRLLILVATTCGLPILVLAVAGWSGMATAPVVLYLAVTFLAVGAAQGMAMARSLTDPITDVVHEMKRVRDGDLTARVPVTSVDDTGILAEGFNAMIDGLRRAEVVRDSFGRYVSPEVLERVQRGEVELGGQLLEATVLFADIRGFTSMAESTPPTELVARLNRYLDLMVDVVVTHGGRVDKFIGDAIMAVFGVPVEQPDHALRAVQAAREMFERLHRWNAAEVAAGNEPWRIGMGLHSGTLVAGNIGSSRKMEYAIIGDVVNTAGRIQELTRQLDFDLLISEATFERVTPQIDARRLEPVSVKGKQMPVVIYAVDTNPAA